MNKIDTNPNASINVINNDTLMGHIGLTKREHFAAMAMQGYVSENTDGISKRALAEWSVGMADALIEALNKNIQKP